MSAGFGEALAPIIDAFFVVDALGFDAGFDSLAGFGIDEFEISRFGQFDLEGIEDLDCEDVVSLRADFVENFQLFVFIFEKVGEVEDESAAAAEVAGFGESLQGVARAIVAMPSGEGGADGGKVSTSGAGREGLADGSFFEQGERGGVALANGDEGGSGGEAGGISCFGVLAVAHFH